MLSKYFLTVTFLPSNRMRGKRPGGHCRLLVARGDLNAGMPSSKSLCLQPYSTLV